MYYAFPVRGVNNAVAITALSSAKPCLILRQYFWGNVHHVCEINLIPSLNLIKSFYLLSETNWKNFESQFQVFKTSFWNKILKHGFKTCFALLDNGIRDLSKHYNFNYCLFCGRRLSLIWEKMIVKQLQLQL